VVGVDQVADEVVRELVATRVGQDEPLRYSTMEAARTMDDLRRDWY
jgi:hypothetical protein